MFEQLSNPASGMPDVAFEQQVVKFVAERLLEPVSCHFQHSVCSYSLFYIDKSGEPCLTHIGRSKWNKDT